MQNIKNSESISFSSFTTRSPQLSNKLSNDVVLSNGTQQITVKALWDTGATNSCISSEVVRDLSLCAVGAIQIHTPSSTSTRPVYLLDVILPNNVGIKDVKVSDSEIGKQGIGILIGMDIILLGDFAVSNYNGKTTFSFRIPSLEETDYNKRMPLVKIPKQYPNDKCACGSGLKYKQCCGASKLIHKAPVGN